MMNYEQREEVAARIAGSYQEDSNAMIRRCRRAVQSKKPREHTSQGPTADVHIQVQVLNDYL